MLCSKETNSEYSTDSYCCGINEVKQVTLLMSFVCNTPNAKAFKTFEKNYQYLDELLVRPETLQFVCGDFNVNPVQTKNQTKNCFI